MKKAYIKQTEYYLPEKIVTNTDKRLIRKTGIVHLHICDEKETAADLAVKAAEKLFKMNNRDEVDFILFCTQSPDYILPTTACVLQNRLGLPLTCGALDYNLGCSGFIYGLSLAKGLIESGQANNVLLLTGETYSKYINPEDHSVKVLFGDAGAATLLSSMESENNFLDYFSFGTDGSGFEKLIVPVGGSRNRYEATELKYDRDEYGNQRTNRDLCMDGSAISDFALKVVPETVEATLIKAKLQKDEIDYYIFHQANHFMLQFLQEKCGLEDANYWNGGIEEYGNTVSNSLPIAIRDMVNSNPDQKKEKVLLAGYGVGLSWAGCLVDLSLMR